MENSLTLPSHGRRLLAYLIDIIPIIMLVFGFFYFFLDFDVVWHAYINDYRNGPARDTFLLWRNDMRFVSLMVWVVYGMILDLSRWQGTLGKKVMKIKVVSVDGRPLTTMQSLQRNSLKALSILFLLIGVIWIFFDKKRQALHDKAGNAVVVEV